MTGSLVSRFNVIIHVLLHVIMYLIFYFSIGFGPAFCDHTICSLSMSYVRSDIFISLQPFVLKPLIVGIGNILAI